MACGAGLPLLALFVTAGHFLVTFGYRRVETRIHSERAEVHIQYTPGKGAVEKVMQMCTGRGYSIQRLAIKPESGGAENEVRAMRFQVSGRRDVGALIVAIADIKGVISARGETSQDSRASESTG